MIAGGDQVGDDQADLVGGCRAPGDRGTQLRAVGATAAAVAFVLSLGYVFVNREAIEPSSEWSTMTTTRV